LCAGEPSWILVQSFRDRVAVAQRGRTE
jgi:hypothetical protein